MNQPLVSIIIPTYNRAHLIGETLENVLAQTYQNWECIVVDDGSTDGTDVLLASYCEKDARFQYHHRPSDRPKGANACRNYGFEKSTGDYIQWFDSDDLMTIENIEFKLLMFTENVDFVIGNSINFDETGNISRPYLLDYDIPITAEYFITQKIGWITNDVILKRNILNSVFFNEKLYSGQEYNFFSNLLYQTNRGVYLKKDVAKRRIHSGSIQVQLNFNTHKKKELFFNETVLLNDIFSFASKNIINRSLRRMVRFSYEVQPIFRVTVRQFIMLKWLLKGNKHKSFGLYFLWIITNLIFGKGYFIIKQINRNL